METTRIKIHLIDGSVIDGVERFWNDGHVDIVDMCGNLIDKSKIKEVRDAG